MPGKLILNPSGGIAGDMFSAVLISAGANFEKMKETMTMAASQLGHSKITHSQASDGSTQLQIHLESNSDHLPGSRAREILAGVFEKSGLPQDYRDFGNRALEILLKAENKAHKKFNIVVEGHHHHNHDHKHDHQCSNCTHSHHHHHEHQEALLHEAQDIVIDITGAVMGLYLLDAAPEVTLLAPVSVGGGKVDFSHGVLDVPAPATSVILEDYSIPWQKGPIEMELSTPTGVCLLAALGATIPNPNALEGLQIKHEGKSRGGKILDIPPLKAYISK